MEQRRHELPRPARTYSARAIVGEKLETGSIGWSPYYLHKNSCREKALLQARHIDRTYVSHPADQLSAPNEVPNCDMAKIEISLGGCGRSSLDCDAGRCPSRAFVRRRTDGEPKSGCAPASAEQFCLSPLVSAWDCEIIINTFPMSAGDRGSSSMPAMNI